MNLLQLRDLLKSSRNRLLNGEDKLAGMLSSPDLEALPKENRETAIQLIQTAINAVENVRVYLKHAIDSIDKE